MTLVEEIKKGSFQHQMDISPDRPSKLPVTVHFKVPLTAFSGCALLCVWFGSGSRRFCIHNLVFPGAGLSCYYACYCEITGSDTAVQT